MDTHAINRLCPAHSVSGGRTLRQAALNPSAKMKGEVRTDPAKHAPKPSLNGYPIG
jgi:hypothetical protein